MLANLTSALFSFYGYLVLVYMIIVLVSYTSMMLIALFRIRKEKKLDKYMIDEENISFIYSQPVSIIVPAYNEEVGIINSVLSLLTLRYPQYEVIVVSDGSTDMTESLVIEHFQMKPMQKTIRQILDTELITGIWQSEIHPNLMLVKKLNGGKADALNAGINVSSYPYFCSIDGDSILDESSLLRVMKPIVESNKKVIATGGNVRVANGSDVQLGQLTRVHLPSETIVVMQIVEYMRAFLMGRIALSRHNLVLIISGAFSVFSKQDVIDVGGYSRNTVGEDMELVVRLHHENRKNHEDKEIVFTPDPVCWTEAPSNFAGLRSQRKRWHQGLTESLWAHKSMTLNPKYGALGMISFPYFIFIELYGPIIELTGYLYMLLSVFMGDAYIPFALLLAMLFILYGSVFSMTSVLLEAWSQKSYPRLQDVTRLFILSLSEAFWYRPITLVWRVEGIIAALMGNKSWGTIERKGLRTEGSQDQK